MKYFETYTSNTIAGSANQHVFTMSEGEVRTGRIFYRILNGGTYSYSLLFSNILDSTYADGMISHKNLVVDEWEILDARVAVCDKVAITSDFMEPKAANEINNKCSDFTPLTFGGRTGKNVAPGEFFSSDPVLLTFKKDDYLCFEITFSGKTIPYHEESLLPVYTKTCDGWVYNRQCPFPGMIGCDRTVDKRIAFIGDSITQGIGTPHNSYKHWNAVLTDMLPENNAYWNLGIGYARATDMASDGAWAFKAKLNDVVVMCFGVNDILQGKSEAEIIEALSKIVDFLKASNIKVILQTVPPFDYEGEKIELWKNINSYIRTNLSQRVDMFFDNVPFLQQDDINNHIARFGGHPDTEGCRIWAEELYKAIKMKGEIL